VGSAFALSRSPRVFVGPCELMVAAARAAIGNERRVWRFVERDLAALLIAFVFLVSCAHPPSPAPVAAPERDQPLPRRDVPRLRPQGAARATPIADEPASCAFEGGRSRGSEPRRRREPRRASSPPSTRSLGKKHLSASSRPSTRHGPRREHGDPIEDGIVQRHAMPQHQQRHGEPTRRSRRRTAARASIISAVEDVFRDAKAENAPLPIPSTAS